MGFSRKQRKYATHKLTLYRILLIISAKKNINIKLDNAQYK